MLTDTGPGVKVVELRDGTGQDGMDVHNDRY